MNNIDPRQVFDTSPVTLDTMEVGDFVRCAGWSRPRLVMHGDENASGRVVMLADPDKRFSEAHRKLDRDEYNARGGDGNWVKYPNLRRLWEASKGT
jgi:hypothetical protein